MGMGPPAQDPVFDLLGPGHHGFEQQRSVLLRFQFLAVMPDLFLDVAGHLRGEPDLHPGGFPLEDPEAGPQEFLQVKIFRYLKGLFGLMEQLDPVQGKDADLFPEVTEADQVEGPVEEPDPVGVHLPSGLLSSGSW